MDSGELNKLAGGILGALLVFLLLGFFSEIFYHGAGGHADEDRVLAYAVEVEEAGGGEADAGPDFAALLASADPASGEKAFNKCKACHAVEDGVSGVGPHLWGVVGREIAGVGGYGYSDALTGKEGDWGLENLFHFLHNPSGWAPGTKMGFAGLKDDQDKVDLIAWLNEADGSPVEFDVPSAEAGEAAEGEAAQGEAAEGEPELTDGPAESETEPELLDTAEGAGQEESSERDAEEAGVPATGSDTKQAALADEEEAEAKIEAAAESGDETYSEQQSGTDEATASAEPAAGGAALLAGADPAQGEKVFRKCKACHKLEDGAKAVGPHLWGVVGRKIAAVEGFKYSDALMQKDGSWDVAALSAFLENPKDWAPGTKMSFAGLQDEQDRHDVIAYLNQQSDQPLDLGSAGGGAAGTETASSEPGAEAMASAEQVDGADVEADTKVIDNTTTGATIITDEDRVEEIETSDATDSGAAADSGAGADSGVAALLASADADSGKKVFRKCRACHKLDEGAHGVGPSLFGVVGSEVASAEGYSYSDALASKGGVWDLNSLDAFLQSPKQWAPGTKMAFPGLSDAQDRVDVITYLNEADGSPVDLGAAERIFPPSRSFAALGGAPDAAAGTRR